MKTGGKIVSFILMVNLVLAAFALGQSRREIHFPDILGYKTLKCDLHMHTVFSDGLVWPTVRVEEAWREGLDAISITDHIEYQPHKKDIPTNLNRPYEIALSQARDANSLDTEDLFDVMKAAAKQKAFVFWNHPGWQPEHKGWFDTHTTLYENKWMQGIEVVNGDSYYPEALQWCLEKNLTMMADSDIHEPSMLTESSSDNHRSMTLVFAREKSIDAVKEALLEGRTAARFKNQLIGRKKYLDAILKASVEVGKPHNEYKDTIWVEIKNNSDIDIDLRRAGTKGPTQLTLPANATTILKTQTGAKADEAPEKIELPYVAQNFVIDPNNSLPVTLTIDLK
jgi:hypothetical protein